MMSTSWRDKQDPNLINYIAAFLAANSYRLNFLLLSPVSIPSCSAIHRLRMVSSSLCVPLIKRVVFQDFIFNNGGLSVAFIFETSWDSENAAAVFSRCGALSCLAHCILRCNECNGGFRVGMVFLAGSMR
jgi:hypothetical protein